MTNNLKQLRKEVGISQENFARAANLQTKTYRFAEWGKSNTSYTTAKRILDALNKLRVEKGLSVLSLDDLGLTIV